MAVLSETLLSDRICFKIRYEGQTPDHPRARRAWLSGWRLILLIKCFMIARIFNVKTKTVSIAALVVGIANFFSYLLGLLRDNLLANFLPNTKADVYWAAFRVPDFIYGILITGGVTAAFLPVFASYFQKNYQRSQRLFQEVFMLFFWALVVLSLLVFIAAPFLVNWTLPGFHYEQKAQAITLMRIMLVSPILLGASAIFSGVLQYLNLFFIFALSPILYNIGILIGILLFYPLWGLNGLGAGVALGAFLHFFVQIFASIKAGFMPALFVPVKEKDGLTKIFRLMVPRMLSAGAYQINLIVITAIASLLAAGSIKVFNLANNIYCAPIGLVGLSFALAAFPSLSKEYANGQKEKFLDIFLSIFNRILFFILPLSAFLFILRAHSVRLFYGTRIAQGSYFGWWETRLTASSLGVLSLSLFAACLIPFLSRAFFSLHNTITPLKISIFSIALNIALSFALTYLLAQPTLLHQWLTSFLKLNNLTNIAVLGLSIALSLSTFFQFFLLLGALNKKITGLNIIGIIKIFGILFLCSLLAALVVYAVLHITALFLPTARVWGLFLQTSIAFLLGSIVYFYLTFLLGFSEPKIIWRYLTKIRYAIL